MNNTTTPKNNFFVFFTGFIKSNYKIIIGVLIVIFILFLSYQYYSYIIIKNINKNSITYFDAKDLEHNHDFYKLMEKLYSNKDFYSVVSTLEIININIENNNFSLAEKLYLKLLNDKNLQPVYIAAIASHASYTFLNVQFDNSNMNLISNIDNFIDYWMTLKQGVQLSLITKEESSIFPHEIIVKKEIKKRIDIFFIYKYLLYFINIQVVHY